MSNILARSGTVKKASHKHYDAAKGRQSDVLIERYDEYRAIIKDLIAYYESVASSEASLEKSYTKQALELQLPLKQGNQFLTDADKPGLQTALYGLRDNTRKIAAAHQTFSDSIAADIVKPLRDLKATIKAHTEAIASDAGALADELDKFRQHSADAIGTHSRAVGVVGTHATTITAKDDPFLTHFYAEEALKKQLNQENLYTKSIIRHQESSEQLEPRITKTLQEAALNFHTLSSKASTDIAQIEKSIYDDFATIGELDEWEAYKKTSDGQDRMIPKDIPMRDVQHLTFPHQGHETSKVILEGYVNRKTKFTKNYNEAWVVITPAGFLHQFANSDIKANPTPTLSLFLPESTLGAPAAAGSAKNKFMIEARRANKKKASSLSKRLSLGKKKDSGYTFKFRSHPEMMKWWEAIDKLCKASSSIHTNPSAANKIQGAVPEAVRNVGYASPVTTPPATTTTTTQAEAVPSTTTAVTAAPATTSATHGSLAPVHTTVHDSDTDTEGGSSDEEEEEHFADATTPGVMESQMQTLKLNDDSMNTQPAGELPVYSGGDVVVPLEKKAHFNNDPVSNGNVGTTSGLTGEKTNEPTLGQHGNPKTVDEVA